MTMAFIRHTSSESVRAITDEDEHRAAQKVAAARCADCADCRASRPGDGPCDGPCERHAAA